MTFRYRTYQKVKSKELKSGDLVTMAVERKGGVRKTLGTGRNDTNKKRARSQRKNLQVYFKHIAIHVKLDDEVMVYTEIHKIRSLERSAQVHMKL